MMHDELLTVLAVDDDTADAEILRRNLEQIPGLALDFVHVPTADQGEAALSRVGIDVTFVDYCLGAETGLDFLRRVRASGELRPLICLTGRGDEQVATDVLHAGADDYVVKSNVSPETLRRAIEKGTSQYHNRRLEEQNRRLLQELQVKNQLLEKNARHLAELYDTAHQFVDDVSHEFRTPLTVIKEFASILHDGLAGCIGDEQRDYLAIILARVDDLASMVDDMLDISKLEAGLLGVARRVCKPAEIIEPIRPILERKAASRKTTLQIAIDEDLPSVFCDVEKIGRVLVNLVTNAFKFSEECGTVRLWARHDPGDDSVVVGVTDNGPGIHPDTVNLLFERFTQIGGSPRGAVKGFGLGLNIAKELVHLNLGDVGVESKVGQGSTFTFTIPTAQPEPLIRRFLKRLDSFAPGTAVVGLVAAAVEAATDPDAFIEVESFINHHVSKSDLVLRPRPNHWLLVISAAERDIHAALRRFHESWAEENRNRPGPQLPAIELRPIGAWRLADQTPQFFNAFRAQLSAEPAHG